MTTPDPRALVARARQHAAIRAAFGGDMNGELFAALASVLTTALDRIDALTAPVDDALMEEIESLLARTRSINDAEADAAQSELRQCVPGVVRNLLASVRALTAERVTRNATISRLRAFVAAYDDCEGNRCRFSTTLAHDCRCEKDRKISAVCTCGGDALEAARAAIDKEIPNA